jgi:hypothetical protein
VGLPKQRVEGMTGKVGVVVLELTLPWRRWQCRVSSPARSRTSRT